MSDLTKDRDEENQIDDQCEHCGGHGTWDLEPFPEYGICEYCDGTGIDESKLERTFE